MAAQGKRNTDKHRQTDRQTQGKERARARERERERENTEFDPRWTSAKDVVCMFVCLGLQEWSLC